MLRKYEYIYSEIGFIMVCTCKKRSALVPEMMKEQKVVALNEWKEEKTQEVMRVLDLHYKIKSLAFISAIWEQIRAFAVLKIQGC